MNDPMRARPKAPAPGLTETADTAKALPNGGSRTLAVSLRSWADAGYGLWALQGMALAFGIFRTGRGESLVPLTVGAVFVSLGLLVACLRLPSSPSWHGWYPGRGTRPTREALAALGCYLPMLAVAGLTRGDNDFWATRLAGAALMLCSVGHLIYSASPRRQRLRRYLRASATLPIGRVVGALYSGGLWLWVCAATDQTPPSAGDPLQQPWLLLLLFMALLLGLVEGMRWHALRVPGLSPAETRRRGLSPARFGAALLTYALPCAALLLADRWQAGGLLALMAALGSVLGHALEQYLYECMLARCAQAQSTDG